MATTAPEHTSERDALRGSADEVTLPHRYKRAWDSISPNFGLSNVVVPTNCLGGLHRVLLLTGLMPLGLIALIMLLNAMRLVYQARAGAMRCMDSVLWWRALVAGLPAALLVTYVSVTTVSYTIFSVFNCRSYEDDCR